MKTKTGDEHEEGFSGNGVISERSEKKRFFKKKIKANRDLREPAAALP